MRIIRPVPITDSVLVSSNVNENDYPAWSDATTYALGTRAIYVVDNTHWIVESLQAGNTGHTPTGLATDTWWLKVSNTNRWKMFDQVMGTQTQNAGTISAVLKSPNRVDSVALLNIDAATARVTMTDVTDGVVYDKTYILTSTTGITDWHSYFFEPIIRSSDFSASDLPPYSNASIGITLTSSGTVSCGVCVLGLNREMGSTNYGVKVGIQDYSTKQKDQFGNYSILQRAFNKYADMTVDVSNGLVDQMQSILASYRATPIVYVGSDSYGSTIIYGFYKDFSISIQYATYSVCTISLEGLT